VAFGGCYNCSCLLAHRLVFIIFAVFIPKKGWFLDGCYAVPLSAAAVLFAARKTGKSDSASLRALNLVLGGGAAMLVVDHIWNGELFLVGGNIASDLLLGVAMTAAAVGFWAVAQAFAKTRTPAFAKAKA